LVAVLPGFTPLDSVDLHLCSREACCLLRQYWSNLFK